ncbi:hypothetical protein ALC57_09115 [Trachymyrmex cornetzi]|uniref:Uncharacterized protein n=1 Tax=Trachymyrmex cornetzi TaxID=471704 RepID=A0A151J5S7_9HYME|nr:hypothetical protein ALC57_09115 [Trachymyrmex cornetzi]
MVRRNFLGTIQLYRPLPPPTIRQSSSSGTIGIIAPDGVGLPNCGCSSCSGGGGGGKGGLFAPLPRLI